MSQQDGAQEKGKIVPLVWSEAGPPVVANHVIAQYDGNLVYVTFGQANPPIILGDTEEERKQQLDQIQSVTVSPVIRIAMTPTTFRAIAEALQKHIALMESVHKSEN